MQRYLPELNLLRLPIVGLAVLLLLIAIVPAASANDFGSPEQGRSVYDRAGLLTDDEVATLEQRADEVEAAGAPTIVFLRAQDSNFDDTLQDGRDLMEDWDVQSSPDARDGVVIFMNLDPDDLRRGELALIAGEAHFDGGNLPQYEMDRITSEMISYLADDETAQGIDVGLTMIADSLVNGPAPPPEPSRFEEISEDIAAGILSPLNALAAVVVAVLAFVGRNVWNKRPTTNTPATPTTTPPDALIPAAAGALVTRGVGDIQVEATVLDFARRGALAFEPDEEAKKLQVQLLDASLVENPFEQEVWKALEGGADENGFITHEKLAGVRGEYGPAKETLRQNMLDRGWFNPDASAVRTPLYIAGGIALLFGIAGFIFTAVSEQLWGLVGTIALGTAGLAAIIGAASYPSTSEEGEAHAQPWRGYLKGVKDARKDIAVTINLDDAMPYLVAMNASGELDERLKSASSEGYEPAWLNSSATSSSWGAAGFYPYWMSYHAVATSTTSVSAGGASAGSGGSGGSF